MAEARKVQKKAQEGAAAVKQPAQAEPARNYAPRGISGLLAPITRPILRKRAPGAAALMEDWTAIVGPEMAARSHPVKLVGGALTIGCAGPEGLELQHFAPQLISRINLALGREAVTRLRFVRQAGAEPEPDPASEPPPGTMPEPPRELPEGELGDALAALYRGIMSRRR